MIETEIYRSLDRQADSPLLDLLPDSRCTPASPPPTPSSASLEPPPPTCAAPLLFSLLRVYARPDHAEQHHHPNTNSIKRTSRRRPHPIPPHPAPSHPILSRPMTRGTTTTKRDGENGYDEQANFNFLGHIFHVLAAPYTYVREYTHPLYNTSRCIDGPIPLLCSHSRETTRSRFFVDGRFRSTSSETLHL